MIKIPIRYPLVYYTQHDYIRPYISNLVLHLRSISSKFLREFATHFTYVGAQRVDVQGSVLDIIEKFNLYLIQKRRP